MTYKLTKVEKRIIRRMEVHLKKMISYPQLTSWDQGWEAGFRGAIVGVRAGAFGCTAAEAKRRRKLASRYIEKYRKAAETAERKEKEDGAI